MSAFTSIFHPGGYKSVGDEYRKRLSGPPFPITQDTKPVERWFCNSGGCTQWRDEQNQWHGQCAGYCVFG